jgi:dihydroneopterin aldolase
LIETLAQRLADVCLADSRVRAVDVTVHKPEAPVGVPVDDVVVRIRRLRA